MTDQNMDEGLTLMLVEFFSYEKLYLVFLSFIVIAAVLVVRWLVNRSIVGFCEKASLEKHVGNILRMLSKILIYAVGITILLQAWGLPIE